MTTYAFLTGFSMASEVEIAWAVLLWTELKWDTSSLWLGEIP